ncbi:MAG: DUF488 domain-containing protein [Nitrospira sp.]|nr:DUF488 domain-containing protein [Nitrospira sp.]MBS0154906.1 DUF488 domain-containing protein [Nitrospira sp.]MBS0165548.1 DUF488 domain-containing protein [Nitrospira sp.]
MPDVLWTIGHSTRPIDEFITLLKVHHVQCLVDVRTIPRSRHNPQFNREDLSKKLKAEGILYVHMPQLGGLRKAKKDSINVGWRNASFRGYADYMQLEAFWKALDELTVGSRELRTAIMCAEAVPWRCHRSLIADALVSRGWEVRHIMSESKADRHQLTSFAIMENGLLRYSDPNTAPRLFP